MLAATEDEIKFVTEYMASQAPDLEVTFVQKVYAENIVGHVHEVWDVHTDKDRWWVITSPMNLYSQEQFPNMDIALTFHVGLCLRIPRTEKQKRSAPPVEPFDACFRQISDAREALSQAQEVSDFQALGVRCREMLLAFTDAAQNVFPWTSADPPPKRADFKAWVDHVCSVILQGASHEHRRLLFKTFLDAAWKFDNWLTHAKNSTWFDAEAAVSATEESLTLCISTILRHLRGVPDLCPKCGSSRLSREMAPSADDPEEIWERPACQKCGWTGTETLSKPGRPLRKKKRRRKVKGECSIQTMPLRRLNKPTRERD
jgi:ribosomal protein L37AE/L43A